MHQAGDRIHFSFAGDVGNIIPGDLKSYVTLYGNVREEKELHNIYMNSDVLILTSAY
jgi:hypothetical protein